MLTLYRLALSESSKVKSDITKRFTADSFQKVGCTLQASRINNNQDSDMFMLTSNQLTLNEWSKVKSNITKRFTDYIFLKVNCTLQTYRTNNK